MGDELDAFSKSLARPRVHDAIDPYKPGAQYGGEKNWLALGDAKSFVLRAAETPARSIWNFADWIIGDKLPDWEYDQLPAPFKSYGGEFAANLAGGIILDRGVTAVGRLGAAIGQATTAGRVINASVARPARLFASSNPTAAAAARWATSGAAVNFLMSEDGATFSQLMTQIPSDTMQTIGGILATDHNAGQLEKRLKGALEGLFVGSALHMAVRKIAQLAPAYRAAKKVAGDIRTQRTNNKEFEAFSKELRSKEGVGYEDYLRSVGADSRRFYDELPVYHETEGYSPGDLDKMASETGAANRATKSEAGPNADKATADYHKNHDIVPMEHSVQAPLIRPAEHTLDSTSVPDDAAAATPQTAPDAATTAAAPPANAEITPVQGAAPTTGQAAQQLVSDAAAGRTFQPDEIKPLGNFYVTVSKRSGTQVRFPTEEVVIPDAYRLVPSHDPINGFRAVPDAWPNQRRYGDATADGSVERQKVETNARRFDPGQLQSLKSSIATSGAPVAVRRKVTVNGEERWQLQILGGNGRTMSTWLAYKNFPDHAQSLRDFVKTLSGAEVSGEHPLILRIIDYEHVKDYDPLELSAMFNNDMQGVIPTATAAASRSNAMPADVAQRIASLIEKHEFSYTAAIGDEITQHKIIDELLRSGVVGARDLETWSDGKMLNDTGKEAIRNMFTATVFPDPRVYELLHTEGYINIRKGLVGAIGPILRLQRSGRMNVVSQVHDAVLGFNELKSMLPDSKLNGVRRFERAMDMARKQGDMLKSPWRENPQAIALMRVFAAEGPVAIRTKWANIARELGLEEAAGKDAAGSLFGAPQQTFKTPEELFHENFVKPYEQAMATPDVPDVPTLPKYLAGAKPRYNYGSREMTVSFESDVDKALYIVGGNTRSSAHDKYVSWLQKHGFEGAQMNIASKKVRAEIKKMAAEATEPGNIHLPETNKPTAGAEGTAIGAARIVGRGPVAFADAAVGVGATRQIMELFSARVGRLLRDTNIADAEGFGAAYVHGDGIANDMIVFGSRVAHGDLVALEEAFHSFEPLLSPAERESVIREFEKAKAAGDEGAYRYSNPTEYFAITAAERVYKKLVRKAEAQNTPGFKGLALKLWDSLASFWESTVAVIGRDRTARIIDGFLERKYEDRSRSGGLLKQGRVAFSEGTDKGPISAIEKLTGKKLEELRNDAALTAKSIELPGLGDAVPHKMTDEDLVAQNLQRGDINERRVKGAPEAFAAMRAAERLADELPDNRWRSMSDPQLRQHLTDELRQMASITGVDAFHLAMKQDIHNQSSREHLESVARTTYYKRSTIVGESQKSYKLAKEVLSNPNATDQDWIRWHLHNSYYRSLVADVRAIGQGASRLLRSFRLDVNANDILEKVRAAAEEKPTVKVNPPDAAMVPGTTPDGPAATPADSGGFGPDQASFTDGQQNFGDYFKKLSPEEQAAIYDMKSDGMDVNDDMLHNPDFVKRVTEEAGGLDNIRRQAGAFVDDVEFNQPTPSEQAAKLRSLLETAKAPTLWHFGLSMWTKHILSSIRTWTGVAFSEAGWVPAIGGEHWLGALVTRGFHAYKNNPAAAARYANEMRGVQVYLGELFNGKTIVKALKGGQLAMRTGEGRFTGGDVVKANIGSETFTRENWQLWLAKQERLSPEWLKSTFRQDGPLSAIGNLGAKYTNLVSYVSSRPLTTIDEIIKIVSGEAAARQFLHVQAMEKFPNQPNMWARHVDSGMELMFHDGMLVTEATLRKKGMELAKQNALNNGQWLSPKDINSAGVVYAKRWIETHPDLFDAAQKVLERANESATTKGAGELHFGKYGRGAAGKAVGGMAAWAKEAGWPGFIVPFINSSWSIARTAGQHFDVAGAWEAYRWSKWPDRAQALKQVKHELAYNLLSQDPARISLAVGRLSMGVMATAGIAMWASAEAEPGKPWITGSLSKNKSMRAIQEAAGLKDYSIFIPGVGYVSYARMDPYASVVGTIADMATYSKINPGDKNGISLATAPITALWKNFEQKTYLAGITRLLDALESGSYDKLGSMLRDTVVNTTPFIGANLTEQLSRSAERVTTGNSWDRDARSIMDEYMSRVWFWREDLPVKRNIFGDPIEHNKYFDAGLFLPFVYNSAQSKTVFDELVSLGHPFQPPAEMYKGVDLTQHYTKKGAQVYDRWLEQLQHIEIGGKKLVDAFKATIKSPAYQALPVDDPNGREARISMLRAVMEKYRSKALALTREESKTLQDAVKQAADAKVSLRTKITNSVLR